MFCMNLEMALTFHLKVTFIGKPGVNKGSPLRELLFLLISSIAQNNTLFQGGSSARMPMHDVVELQITTYYHVRGCLALSIVHGGPAPQFFSFTVASYIAYGARKLQTS